MNNIPDGDLSHVSHRQSQFGMEENRFLMFFFTYTIVNMFKTTLCSN